jgi:hypothetical protein
MFRRTRSAILLAAKCRRVCVLALLACLCAAGPAYPQFNVLETENLRLVYYGAAQSYLVKYTARCFENSLAFHQALFHYKSHEKITVVVYDPGDYNNAGAGTIPWNAIILAIAPPSYAFETTPSNERINATMHHEIVHLVCADKAAARDRFFRSVFFGKVSETSEHPETILYSYLTCPRRAAPRWYHEGIAVFLETWMSGGLGRALSSYDEMVFRTAVQDSARLYDMVGLESEGTKINFQVGSMSYLYGGRFMSYLALRYGPEKLIAWTSRTDSSSGYFAAQFKKVYGGSLDDAWREWLQWERQFQSVNLDSIRQYPTTERRILVQKPLGSVSRPQYDAGRQLLYAAIDYPGKVGHLAEINTANGQIGRLKDVKGAALYFVCSIAYDSTSRTLFYTTDNGGWRNLEMLDLNTGKSRQLQHRVRIGDLSFNHADQSLWGVRHFNGITTIVRIPPPYTEWNQVYSTPYGRDVYGLDVSPDGRFLSAGMAEIDGRQRLVYFSTDSLLHGDTSCAILFDFKNSVPENFVHSADGRYLYGTSYYTGVSNIFRYDLQADSMEALTNSMTGLFNPVPVSDDSLIAFEYASDGFIPVKIAIRPIDDVAPIRFLGQEIVKGYPIVTTWLAGSPGKVPIDSLKISSGPYHSLANIRLASLYPVVEGYQDMVAYGFRADLRDPISLNRLNFTVSYSPDRRLRGSEKWHADMNYDRGNWSANARYNDADFYDLFGPTKFSRKGYAVGLAYRGSFIEDDPRRMGYRVGLTRYGDLVKLPEFQNITTSFDRFWSLRAGLTYSYQVASLGAVDYEKGVAVRTNLENKYVNSHLFILASADLDIGIALPIGHSAVWFRNSVGYSPNRREEPLANFYFGGFGNNWVDSRAEKQYRQSLSFPGIGLNAVGGTRYTKNMLEWVLPPVRFRRLGMSSFYATWARPALFSSILVANIDDASVRRELANLGAQLDFRLIMLSHLNMTLSFGYAAAIERDARLSKEFMMSLKVL